MQNNLENLVSSSDNDAQRRNNQEHTRKWQALLPSQPWSREERWTDQHSHDHAEYFAAHDHKVQNGEDQIERLLLGRFCFSAYSPHSAACGPLSEERSRMALMPIAMAHRKPRKEVKNMTGRRE